MHQHQQGREKGRDGWDMFSARTATDFRMLPEMAPPEKDENNDTRIVRTMDDKRKLVGKTWPKTMPTGFIDTMRASRLSG